VPDEICQGESVQLSANASGGSGAYNFTWSSNPAGFTSSEENPVVSPDVKTKYTVEVNDGFTILYGTVEVEVYPMPVVICPPDISICENSPPFELTGAIPVDGIYSGEGVFMDDDEYFFNPSSGTGMHNITYTFTTDNGCTDSCSFIITITPNPEILQANVTDETDYQQNGAIEIIATGITPHLYYSIDEGINWQSDNGLFEDLSAGIYYCIVRDENNCDTSFILEINNIILTPLEAITGPDELCLGNIATVPIRVDRFVSVASFQLKLSYNADRLTCAGYTNIHPALEDNFTGSVNQVAGEITLQWHSDLPVTFILTETVVDLVFATKDAGQGQLEWYATATESYFHDATGMPIPAEFYAGIVDIYELPEIFLDNLVHVCEGQPVSIYGIAQSAHPPLSYLWVFPDGHSDTTEPYIDSVTQANAGDYTLIVTDAKGCTEQRSAYLAVSENPVAAFHGTDTLEVPPGYILDAGPGMESYLWNTGGTSQSIAINTEGMYTVEMISMAGCYGIDSVYVLFVPVNCLEMPNVFSPNGDGRNDIFKPVHICPITYYRLIIYNRWGEKLFESGEISLGWDGKKNGVDCPGEMYVYKISYIVESSPGVEVKNEKAGMFLLLK
jgi:gliding motility-associated-like protein